MHTQRTKNSVKRRLLLAVVVILAGLLQNCALPVGRIGILLLIPLTVIIAMFEKEFVGIIYGILAGCIWDLSTATSDGMKALFLALTGCICGLLIRYIIRNTLLSALALCSTATLLFSVDHWLFHVVAFETGAFGAFLRFYFPQMLITVLLTPFFYVVLRALEKKYRAAENKEGTF